MERLAGIAKAGPAVERALSDGRMRASTGLVVIADVRSRALAIWPGLDRTKLTRTCGDPHRVARLVERRTTLSRETILGMLGVLPPASR